MSLLAKQGCERFSEILANLIIPHHKNDHRPHLIRSSGLFIIFTILLILQAAANFSSPTGQILGFATNISTSEIIRLTNLEREKVGARALRENPSLSKAAQLKAEDMFSKDYWAHFAPDGTSPWYFFGLVGYKYSWAGENLARDFATSAGVVAAWMASSGHRSNILNPNFTEIGVAVINGNLEGEDTTLVVQLFGTPATIASVAPAEKHQAGQRASQPAKLEANLELPKAAEEGNKQSGEEIRPEEKVGMLPGSTSSKTGITIPILIKNITTSQKVTVSLLLLVVFLFITDSVIIFRKRHVRVGSHSFAHTLMVLGLMIVSLLTGYGTIL